MTLEGCWRFYVDEGWKEDDQKTHGLVVPWGSDQPVNGRLQRHYLCWQADLTWLMSHLSDLHNNGKQPRRLTFTAPAEVASSCRSGDLQNIPFRVRPGGEIDFGRKCNRFQDDGKYQRNYRIRWRPTEWRITPHGLCHVSPRLTDGAKSLHRGFPEYVVRWIESLYADEKATLTKHGKLMGSCALCGKPIAPGYGIGPECQQLVES